MKTIKSLLTFGLSAVTALTITSCQDFDFMDEAEIKHDLTMNEYAQNFVAHYGSIDPNHTWGFGAIKGEGVTRANNKNKNEWESVYHLTIPGWPDEVTGKYNYSTTGAIVQTPSSTEPSLDGYVPAGDVTEEEIQYVSWWFRTNYKPTTEIVHWTDFYVQEISSDNDRNDDGTVVTATVNHYYNNNTKEWETKPGSELSKFTIDYFEVKTFDGHTGENTGSVQTLDGYDHIYDFNNGISNNLVDCSKVPMKNDLPWNNGDKTIGESHQYRLCGFYTSSGTEDFMAHYSNDSEYRNLWVIKHLVFDGPSGRHYDGWYLGFDFEYSSKKSNAENYNEIVPDGYYSNWILKLTPATPLVESGFTRRVMCEDLGNTCDFDFNDVVFDVTYNIESVNTYKTGDNVDATITIQAAGGTMPIYVGYDPRGRLINANDCEAHKLLGNNPSNTPVNVGGTSSGVAIYHVTLNSLDPADISIVVNNGGNYYYINEGNHGLGSAYTGSKNDDHQTIINGSNSAPQSFCVPPFVAWMKESKFVETGYPKFKEWAQSEEACPEDSENAWFRTVSNTGNIHNYTTQPNVYIPEIGKNDGNNQNDPYKEYGTKFNLSTIDYFEGYSMEDLSGNITVTAIFSYQNSEHGNNDAKLVPVKYVTYDGGYSQWIEGNTDDVKSKITKTVYIIDNSKKIYTITFAFNKNDISDFTHFKFDGITADNLIGYYIK